MKKLRLMAKNIHTIDLTAKNVQNKKQQSGKAKIQKKLKKVIEKLVRHKVGKNTEKHSIVRKRIATSIKIGRQIIKTKFVDTIRKDRVKRSIKFLKKNG